MGERNVSGRKEDKRSDEREKEKDKHGDIKWKCRKREKDIDRERWR